MSHDDLCESIEVDIGVGALNSPCGCDERSLRARIAELERVYRALDEECKNWKLLASRATVRRISDNKTIVELERDQARLDWLEQFLCDGWELREPTQHNVSGFLFKQWDSITAKYISTPSAKDLRSAIDAAAKQMGWDK